MARYIEILFRYKLRFLVLLALLPTAVGAVTIVVSPSYKASAQLWADYPSYFGGATPSGWSQYLTPAQNEADSLTQLLNTGAFGRDLTSRLATAIPDPSERRNAVNGAKISVFSTGSHLITISATCAKPGICIAVLNAAISVLRDQQIDGEKIQAQAGVQFLTAQLHQTKADLTGSESELRTYLVAHPGAKVDADPATITDPELSKIALKVQQQRTRVNDLQDQLNRDDNIVSVSTALIAFGPRVIDPPQVNRGGLIGDGSGLKKAAAATGVTMVLGVAYLFLMRWTDKTMRDPREIERRFKLPVVVAIPELSPPERF